MGRIWVKSEKILTEKYSTTVTSLNRGMELPVDSVVSRLYSNERLSK